MSDRLDTPVSAAIGGTPDLVLPRSVRGGDRHHRLRGPSRASHALLAPRRPFRGSVPILGSHTARRNGVRGQQSATLKRMEAFMDNFASIMPPPVAVPTFPPRTVTSEQDSLEVDPGVLSHQDTSSAPPTERRIPTRGRGIRRTSPKSPLHSSWTLLSQCTSFCRRRCAPRWPFLH